MADEEELTERDIIMINRGMEIRRRSDYHGYPPLNVAPPSHHFHGYHQWHPHHELQFQQRYNQMFL